MLARAFGKFDKPILRVSRALAIPIGFALVFVTFSLLGNPIYFITLVGAAFGVIISLHIKNLRSADRLQYRLKLNEARSESLIHLFSFLRPSYPIPRMEDWKITPEVAFLLAEKICERRPLCIVELGSGVSSLVDGYCLRNIGAGKALSIDHDKIYAQQSAARVDMHGLAQYVQVVHAPLTDIQIGQEVWRWYDLDQLDSLTSIDLLFIDGPAWPLSRYPALPVLYPKLSRGALVVVDDYHRPKEKLAVKRWLAEYQDISLEEIASEKGIAILVKR